MQPQVYDSGDPNLPNLPDTDQIMWSDYDDYLSNKPSSSSSSESYNQSSGSDHEGRRKKAKRRSTFSNSKKSRRNSIISKKSDKSSISKKPTINIFGTHNEFIDSDSENVLSEHEKENRNNQSDGDDDIIDEKLKKDSNARHRSKTNVSKVSSYSSSGVSSGEDDHHTGNRQRSGSIFTMLHFPRLIHRSSGKNTEISGQAANNLTRTESEMHGRTASMSNPPIINTPIIQPTRAHSIAAGAIDEELTGSSEKHSFSNLPPSGYYDEEAGRGIGPEAYTDRDVQYYNVKQDHSTDSGSIECSNSDALGSGGQLNGNENKEFDDANLSDIEDNIDGDDSERKKEVKKFSPLERYGISVASGGKIKKVSSRTSSKLSNRSSIRSNGGSHKVEIDQRNRKVAKTDTDDESLLHVPSKTQYQPTSILRKDRVDGEDEEISPDEVLNGNGYEEDDESEDVAVGNATQPPTHKARKKRAARRRRRKSRKYVGSQSKKERTAWEPGIDLRTTNVFLNSPGSIITITDYSKSRYRISHYDLYSEMNPKYTKFTTDDTILSAHDFDEEYDEANPEFNDFIDYMNKVTDSHKEVEDAIQDKPLWSQVRWININGLSWEAISIIGKKYNLHPLSVEDLVDIPQRTKMDIYQQHLFVVMPLMKLLKVKKISDESHDTYFERLRKNIRELATGETHREQLSRSPTVIPKYNKPTPVEHPLAPPKVVTKTIATREQLSREFSTNSVKTIAPSPDVLQVPQQQPILTAPRKNISRIVSDSAVDMEKAGSGDSNHELNRTRSAFNDNILPRSSKTFKRQTVYSSEEEYKLAVEIEKSSRGRRLTDLTFITPSSAKYKSRMASINKMRPLMSKSLAVGVEQVSMYLTVDGTVLSFFEHSAMDIERAILSRLSAEYTILRETCNPSILFHSVLDANVDLLYPVITAYSRILNEKELEILTASLPDLQHTQELHLMLNELAILKNSILPISSLITQLKDLSMDSNSGFIDESCKLYLADIGDHLLAFIDEIDSMSSTIENLIDLIFNTLSVETNNSMQQLSLVSVLFLPLTFWAGYFGMNFKSFGNIDMNVSFFWKLAIPFTAGMMILVMRNSCWRTIMRVRRMMLTSWNRLQVIKNGEEDEFDRRRQTFNPDKWANLKRKMRKRD